jgi:hypothetical protein
MKRLRVLRAFTASLRAPDDPSAGSAVTAWLAGVKPARAALFSYLGVQWPEFAAFEGQHLADVESAAAPTAGSVTPP